MSSRIYATWWMVTNYWRTEVSIHSRPKFTRSNVNSLLYFHYGRP